MIIAAIIGEKNVNVDRTARNCVVLPSKLSRRTTRITDPPIKIVLCNYGQSPRVKATALISFVGLFSENDKSLNIHNPFDRQLFATTLPELNIPSVNRRVALAVESLTRFSALDIYHFIVERVLVSPTIGASI